MTRKINLIVIHCTATPNGKPFTVEDIDRWHIERGFHRSDYWRHSLHPSLHAIGYHYIIYTNGEVCQGRHLGEIGAHAVGHNAHSLGICLIGNDKFTTAQWTALDELYLKLSSMGLKPPDAVFKGHRELSPDKNKDGRIDPYEWIKTCPGFDVATWIRNGRLPKPEHILT